ncbi:DNA/RNA polymerase [Wolfiporia cocos MD-104 SS10]|uniref:DNA polymerase n=1 Tax=Wolfiporia cocos (strain MD-104) TaxID=742152 RepID=A0A2H3J595_WOLCO|nr:DNA/RNA polymerase [Wolfiporia cocos MD-104 SS10]
MASIEPSLRVRVNQLDYTLAQPGPLDNCSLPRVPAIRIYGESSVGKKACVHVHQVYPYFFVEYSGKIDPQHVHTYIAQLKHSLNYAIAVSLKRNPHSPNSQFVRAIILVKGVHFYGFHSSYSPFLKVLIVDPAFVSRAVTILQSGTVMKTRFHVYESHLSYILQFMCDFALYGCGWMDLDQVWERGIEGTDERFGSTSTLLKDDYGFEASPHFRQSRMPLEVDVAAHQILNRHRLVQRELHHKLKIPADPLPPEPLVPSVRELWEDERRRRIKRGLPPSPEIPQDPSANSRGRGGEWVAEARWWEEIRNRIERECGQDRPVNLEMGWERFVMTTFESIEALWEDERKVWKPKSPEEAVQSTVKDVTKDPPNAFDETLTQACLGTLSSKEKDAEIDVNEAKKMTKLSQTSKISTSSSKDIFSIPSRESLSTQSNKSSSSLSGFSQASVHRNNSYIYALPPPTVSELLGSMETYGVASKIYVDPHYSKARDAPARPREYAGLVFHLKGGNGLSTLEEWVSERSESPIHAGRGDQQNVGLISAGVYGWEYAGSPPSAAQARQWLKSHPRTTMHQSDSVRIKQSSQIEGPTQANVYGFRTTQAKPSKSGARERQNMTVFSLEVFAPSKGDYMPDPEEDEVGAVFYSYQDSADFQVDESDTFLGETGMIVVQNKHPKVTPGSSTVGVEFVASELDLLNRLIDLVIEVDPDIVIGWEVQAASWGYINSRASTYGLDLGEQISRAPSGSASGGPDQWGMRTTSTFRVVGRHVLNLWRIMRAEQNLTSYTFENVAFHLLHRRIPRYTPKTLTEWYGSNIPYHANNVYQYFLSRVRMDLEIVSLAEVVTKNAEFARVFGVDFFSVLSRGSQFKVESFMFRIAKPEGFVLLSPSKEDVGKQNAAECMPLIMEPLSAFYNSPLVVLDFQSLYPSIMIAYNYCYSTCLGRVTDFKGQNKFGVMELRQPPGLLETLKDHINVAPNGIMYVKQDVRRGLLGRMLTELLDTRVMVKQAMKGVKDDKALKRILDARQLGLKFIANVTYGYTSATYSGRMPAVEIADSIVQSGRETLEKAVHLIDSTKKWGAKVVYGDTDSLFVYLRGKTKEQAFRIGYDMAETITALNPAPVKLKFEKVYLPCVLMAKKRYVGFKFENPDDVEPVFDAKGIETVRRDGIPAQQKMTETCLKILFRTQDLSQVKEYCYRSWTKILENKVSIQDFIFAKEVKMGTYSDKGPPPPGVTVAARRMVQDPNDEPQYGERVPYVIARGSPDSRLVDRAVTPEEMLNNRQKRLDAAYYISRVLIPPLERIFNLVGADVRGWYDEMPKAIRTDRPETTLFSPHKGRGHGTPTVAVKIEEHFARSQCTSCNAVTSEGLCKRCRAHPETTISTLLTRVRVAEDRLRDVQMTCSSCSGSAPAEPIRCESLDCPWLYERKKGQRQVAGLPALYDLIDDLDHGVHT